VRPLTFGKASASARQRRGWAAWGCCYDCGVKTNGTYRCELHAALDVARGRKYRSKKREAAK
jgi:hypothetical protein